MSRPLKAPFPYFGGKSAIAPEIWRRFGDAQNYVDPFAGSIAVLLARPEGYSLGIETVNDMDGMISNFWRAVVADPDAVATAADWPVSEPDLHARHMWLVRRKPEITSRLMGDTDYFDAKAAGWWVWGICSWIGSGWCSGDGPWTEIDGKLVNSRQLPHLGDAGMGVNRKLPHLGNAGRGINRKRPHLGNAGRGQCAEWSEHLRDMMRELADRLRRVRVCCGEWSRVCGPTPTEKLGVTAVLLDPPYSSDRAEVYTEDCFDVAHDVRRWAIERGDNPKYRIALCGHLQEHDEEIPANWTRFKWKARGGYESQNLDRDNENSGRETIWFSPHCLSEKNEQLTLWDTASHAALTASTEEGEERTE